MDHITQKVILDYKFCFRYIVFRPYIDEILQGTLIKQTSDGIQISLEFFDDIFVYPDAFPDFSEFNTDYNSWCWRYTTNIEENSEDGKMNTNPDDQLFYFETGKSIRFRVIGEQFVPNSRNYTETNAKEKTISNDSTNPNNKIVQNLLPKDKNIPYSIIVVHLLFLLYIFSKASISESGLGMVSWWS
ncbi:MAG: DNA-directed RNA polymerase III subunit RPC8 [Marteilia pararefringens]